jgi:hypothetical protein
MGDTKTSTNSKRSGNVARESGVAGPCSISYWHMNELLREFFYDGICRIIPGLIITGLYGRQLLVEANGALQDITKDHSLVFLVPCVLLAAWLIGVMVDIVTLWLAAVSVALGFICYVFFEFLDRRYSLTSLFMKLGYVQRFNRFVGTLKPKLDNYRNSCFVDDWQRITKPGADVECRQRMKQLAEKSFFRVMAIVSLLTVCYQPPAFGGFQSNLYYGICGSIVFSLGWLWTFYWLREWRKRPTETNDSAV